jgi:asparagine synthase (glutamine-hydrolysing)
VCGIAGIVRARPEAPVDEAALRRMGRALRHRGPDGWGLALDAGAGLVATRLAMVGVEDGWQPMRGDQSVLVYNGEVYGHRELGRGMDLRTRADTEVVLRLLERDGPIAALRRCNGEFALAWWEPAQRRLTLARDRFGVRPLLYAQLEDGSLVFGSEARALFASGAVAPVADLDGLDEVFTLWGARAPRTVFAGVRAVAPGGLVVWQDGRIVDDGSWWEPDLALSGPEGDLEALLRDAVRIRLQADVPVGAYLSGGLDSSLVTALAAQERPDLRTFSVAFDDPRYDERPHQRAVADALGTEHHVLHVTPGDVADGFEDVVEHAETPLVRTAPAPLYALARATRALGITAVLTGEGADELFWGYDLYKEVALRRAGDGAGLDALYPQLGGARRGDAWRRAFLDAGPADDPLFSHQPRANATGAVRGLYRAEVAAAAGDPLERLRAELPPAFAAWGDLERAQWLELRTLLEPYLLSAQADRVAMAHGVEGRFPFLDHRVFAHAAALPPERKLDGMRDKVALRELAAWLLPPAIAERRKQPYRAPEVAPFFAGATSPAWVDERLSAADIDAAGVFDPVRVEALLRRCRAGRATGPREAMALVAVLSTQIWHDRCLRPRSWPEEQRPPRVRLDLRPQPARST